MNNPISIRLFPEQKQMLRDVSRSIRMSQQDCMRNAIVLGLPILKKTMLDALNGGVK